MRFLIGICALALVLGLATSVYAETQSIKISGDLTMRGILRDDYDLSHNDDENPSATAASLRTGGSSNWQSWFMTTTEVQLDADLTDNVAAVIRLFNQRDWGVSSKSIRHTTGLGSLGREGYTSDSDEFDVGVDLAYIELKEFLYSPLTLRIGRQDLWFGKGFIVGANLRDYNANISADEYTTMQSFDTIRATLDYDPWTIDGIFAKIWENVIDDDDDVTLLGVNVGYVFDVYNAEAETYWFYKHDTSIENWNIKDDNIVHTLGIRGSADPIENWTIAAEVAWQGGEFVGFREQSQSRARCAYAIDASVETRHFAQQYAWQPILGVEYILYSGDRNAYPEPNTSNTYNGWDAMYRGKFDTAYREFVGLYNITAQGRAGYRANYIENYQDLSTTNQHQVIIYGSIQPTDSLTLDTRYALFWQYHDRAYKRAEVEPARSGSDPVNRNNWLGSEIDVQLTWDYTEDVSFGLLGAWFFPGSFYYDQSDDIAQDIVGTVKLSF